MRLLWIRYTTRNQSKHGLFMVIGDDNGDIMALKSKLMAPGDVKKIRASLIYLEESTTSQRMEWIKKFCATSYRKAFRRLRAGTYQIISEHQPKR